MNIITGKFDPIDQAPGGALEKAPREIWAVFMYGYGFNDEENLSGRFARIEHDGFYLYAYQADLNYFVDDLEGQKVYGESGELLDWESVIPYLKSYADGFWEGYNSFKSIVDDEIGVFGGDMILVAERVFREITTSHHALSSRGYLNNRQKIIKHDLFLEHSKKVGASYRAWFYIVNNPKPFVQLFRENFLHTFIKVETLLREYNSHHPEYRTELSSIIEASKNHVSEATNSQSEAADNPARDENYCISIPQIEAIHKLCKTNNILHRIDLKYFIPLFDLNHSPQTLPKFQNRKQVWFCYILSQTGITATQALNNFGISQYRNNKSNALRSTTIKQVFKNEVGRILNPTVKLS